VSCACHSGRYGNHWCFVTGRLVDSSIMHHISNTTASQDHLEYQGHQNGRNCRDPRSARTSSKHEANSRATDSCSSLSGRLQHELVLNNFIEAQPHGGSTFVYISGPEGLANGAEVACIKQQRELRVRRQQHGSGELSWHNATFTV
jgi:hypothetical protein